MKIKMLCVVLLLVMLCFAGCNEKRKMKRKMPKNTIAITDRLEVHDGPTYVGRWHAYILKDTLTEKQFLVIGNYDCVSVTPLEVAVEK